MDTPAVGGMVVAAAMRIEAAAARRALRGSGVEVVRLGMGGTRLSLAEGAGPVVMVGVCGALVPLRPGTVVVPDEVAEAEGPPVRCEGALVARLRETATAAGWPVAGGRLLTLPRIVRGTERARWAAEGFTAVDMETAPVLRRWGGAAVRVVLDSPGAELPRLADLPFPRHWPDAARIGWRLPVYAQRAASVAAGLV